MVSEALCGTQRRAWPDFMHGYVEASTSQGKVMTGLSNLMMMKGPLLGSGGKDML